MDWHGIQQEVRYLHRELWRKRHSLCPYAGDNPLRLLEPQTIARVLDVQYQELGNLGEQVFSLRGKKFSVAGLVDRQAGRIAVSDGYSDKVKRFTAGHEFGHWVLHPNEVIHRDRPIDGSWLNMPKPAFEKEADFFSACLLLPDNLLKQHFRVRFQTDSRLVFNETAAFHVCPQRTKELVTAQAGSLERELAVARCRSFGGNHFDSLADTFRVSDTAMARRIKELGLIEWP
tara:strand:- start:42700 stop:43392 length:693 start_codon:yes stop_codon:yes gene_type:complete